MCTFVHSCAKLVKTLTNVDFAFEKAPKKSGEKRTVFSPATRITKHIVDLKHQGGVGDV